MLSSKEYRLIMSLRQDGRQNLTTISKAIHMPVSTIFEKLKRYEQDMLLRCTCLLDFAKLGYNTRANIILDIPREQRELAKDFLSKHMNVNSLFRTNNNCLMLEGVFKDINQMEEFFESLEQRFQIRKKEVHYIITEIKKENFLSDPLAAEILCSAGISKN